MGTSELQGHVRHGFRSGVPIVGEEGDRKNHLRVSLAEPTDVPVDDFVPFLTRRILSLHLDWPNELADLRVRLRDDEIEARVTMGEVNVPPRIGEAACNVE